MKNVLVLGAGLVSRPMIDYLLKNNIHVEVASRTVSKAEALVEGYSNGKATQWTVDDNDKLENMVQQADVVVSLLPYAYHLQVAHACIKHKKHMVTTSYVKQEMQDLDSQAKEAGILILNEIGLDPGIDHMSAMRTIHKIREKNGKVISFRSICGALPSPDASKNPFRYKFGWSPKGVALAGLNTGKYKEEDKIIDIESKDLFKHYHLKDIPTVDTMEIYTNRNALPYLEKYSIEEAKTIFRGTVRFQEWCDLWYVISNFGLLDTEEKTFSKMTYNDLMKSLANGNDPKTYIKEKFNLKDTKIIDKLDWLGLFSDEIIDLEKGGNIDALIIKLTEKLSYLEGEKDMVILQDETIAQYDGKTYKHTSTLIDYGNDQDTAVARTVSLPAACAVKLLLEDKIKVTGVYIPVLPEIYNPILDELETLGIKSKKELVEL